MTNLLIDILAFTTLLSSILVITSKNPVISIIFLISVFVNAAGYLMFKGIGFIGISYIIIYIGAIAVLFLFVILMINIRLTDILETGSQYTKNLPLGLAISSLFLFELFQILPFSFNNVTSISALLDFITNLNNLFLFSGDLSSFSFVHTAFNLASSDYNFINFLQIQSIGQHIYTSGAFLLIITSLILLLALIAPIFISRKH
jgi:NADH-ubiquinone oxidoreductase chain 6